MTSEQKRLMDQCRRHGMGSTEIAKKLNLSVNTVKSYCRRNAVERAATDGGAAPSGIVSKLSGSCIENIHCVV